MSKKALLQSDVESHRRISDPLNVFASAAPVVSVVEPMSSSGGGVTVTAAVSGQQRAQPPAVAAVAAATPLNPAAVEFRPAPIDVTAVAQEVMMEQQPAVVEPIAR